MRMRVNGFEMVYEDSGGSGVPLLLIHGFPFDRTLWKEQVGGLSDVARVIAPDLRGFGESGMPTGMVTIETFTDDMRALLDALNIQKAVVAGLSMGGYIALTFYRQYKERVRGLMLVDTRAVPDSPEGKKGRDENAVLAREKGTAAVAAKTLSGLLSPQTFATQPDVVEMATAMTARQPVEGVVAALMAMRDRLDSTALLTTISVPTLVVSGGDDTLIPVTEAESMHKAIRGSQLIIIPDAAHLPNLEQPRVFNQAVRDFLKIV